MPYRPYDPIEFERAMPAEIEREPFEQYEAEFIDVEATHAAADRHGYDLASTPLDNLFANSALGFDTAGAMQ